jgi:TRAP-type mannitol/chloroaromatic compound transport system substrate-binding protein
MNRRTFLKKIGLGSVAIGSVIGFPAILRAAPEKYKWKMVTTWPKNFPGLGTGANHLASMIESMSEGRIQIKVYGAGELVPALGCFDAVRRGIAQMGHGAAYYWKGKHAATQFFAAVPFGLSAMEMNTWLQHGGAQNMWDSLYADFGLKPFNVGNTGVQMGGWFNKEINTVKDFKGLKMRMPGLGGEVLKRMGSTVVTLAGGDIFPALKGGTIDATEWIGPYNDLAFGLHQAAKFYYWPGWHEPGTTIELIINKAQYETLPKDLKQIITTACQAASLDMLTEFLSRNASSLVQLNQKHKVQLKRFPDAVLKEIRKHAKEVVHGVSQKDPVSKKVYESYQAFQKQSIGWSRISEEGYSLARNLSL